MDPKDRRKDSLLRQLAQVKKPVLPPIRRFEHFGVTLETEFSKHQFPVKQVIWNPISQVYASLDDKNMCLFDTAGTLKGTINFFEETQTHLISCFLHIGKFRVYVLISSDFKMLVYSEILELIHKAEMSRTGSRVLAAYFLEARNLLIMVGISAVGIAEFVVVPKEGNSLENDMTSKTVDIRLKLVLTIPTPIEWIRKSYFQPESQLIVLWDQASVCLQSILDENAKVKYENVVRNTTLMEVLLIPEMKCFVAGMLSGEIYVIGYFEPKPDPSLLYPSTRKAENVTRMEDSPKADRKKNARMKSMSPMKTHKKKDDINATVPGSRLGARPTSAKNNTVVIPIVTPAHIYIGHIKAVVTLSQIPDFPALFLSGSLDGTISLWSLQKFSLLYTFKIMQTTILSSVNFINSRLMYCTIANQVFVGNIKVLAECFATFTSNVKAICRIAGDVGVLGEDDGTVILDTAGQVVSIVYPLPTFVNVKQIIYSVDLDRIFWLLHSGSLCRIRREKERGVLERVLKVGDVKDTEGRAILAAVNCMKLARHMPPRYDFEATIKTFSGGNSVDLTQFQGLSYPEKFFILSVGRGLVMFVPMEKPEIVYTKISVNRETVIDMEELEDPKLLILLTENNGFLACSYTSATLEAILQLTVSEAITCIRPIDPNSLYLAYQSGETHIWEWKQSSFFQVSENKSQVHSGAITKAILVHAYSLIVTTTGSEFIKFWSISNVFLKEIKFPSPVADLFFCTDLNVLLIAHGKVVSKLHSTAFPTYTDVETDVWMQNPPEVDVAQSTKEERKEVSSLEPSFVYLPEVDVSVTKQKKISVDGDTEIVDVLRLYDEIKEKQRSSSRTSLNKSSRRKRKPRKKVLNITSSPAPKYRDLEKMRLEEEHTRTFRKEYLETISKPLEPYIGRRPDPTPVFLTRRQLTEEKIISNIIRYGDPADRPDVSGLRVVAEEGRQRNGAREEL